MTTPLEDLKFITSRIKQQNKIQKERQQTIPRTKQCTGCSSTNKLRLAYQVIACKECATFMQDTLTNGLRDMECTNKGAETKQLANPTFTTTQNINKVARAHCKRHRFIQLLAKGFSTPTIENIAIGGQNFLEQEMKKALFIGAIKIAGEKYGFHETQSSSSISSITKELSLTENCCDLKQMIGSLAQPQVRQQAERTVLRQEQRPKATVTTHQATATEDTRLKYLNVAPRGRKPYMIHKKTGKIIILTAPINTATTVIGLAKRPEQSQ